MRPTAIDRSNLLAAGTAILATLALFVVSSAAQPPNEQNVVYGMVSGTALLMDVYRPDRSNERAVITVYGNAWSGPESYDGWQLKRLGAPGALVDAGFTVFVVNHRLAPRFRYPAAVEDVQRAVRFLRFHADRFGIDPERIGAFGASSGGHLVAMLGTLPGDGDGDDPDPVNRVSAKVQAVAAHASAVDFTHPEYRGQWGPVSFLGLPPIGPFLSTYREASPVTHVTSDDAPFLLVHGAEDEVVPVETIEGMAQALEEAGVAVVLDVIPDAGHGITPDSVASARWLTKQLLGDEEVERVDAVLRRHERIAEAVRSARAGETAEAIELLAGARSGGPLRVDLFPSTVLCRQGGLGGFAREVVEECDNAVAIAPDDPYVQGIVREARAIVRALLGDFEGSARDLEVPLAYASDHDRDRRTTWIRMLREGRNPFDAALLERLREAGGL